MKNCLLIDCYDSFTFKLAQTIEETGLCKVDVEKWDLISESIFRYYDAVVLSPGPGLPHEYPEIFRFLSFLRNKPVLGVCLGHQIISKYCNAEIYHTGIVYHGQNLIIKNRDTIGVFKGVSNEFQVGLYHSWAVRNIPAQLKITAESDNEIIMGLKHTDYPWHTVQFHPESYMTKFGNLIIENWLNSI